MAFNSYGFHFSPEYLEALMVMGNGASFVDNNVKHPLVFFDNGLPDISINNCLRILGFQHEDFFIKESDGFSIDDIQKKLQHLLKNGSVVIGPLDMGYLTYNPNCVYQRGVDHFVCAYGFYERQVYLHDPAGYPCMKMKFGDFVKAWTAEGVAYKRGAFSMWGNFARIREPEAKEIYHDISVIMKKRYEQGDANVIEQYANSIRENGLNQQQKQIHQFFSFRLAAVRNIYLSRFLKEHDRKKADLKEQMADLFGQAHLDSMKDDYKGLSNTLTGGKHMDARIQRKDGFAVAGVKLDNINSFSCPEAWDQLYATYSHDILSRLGNGQSYGMCFDVENPNKINYMACYHVSDIAKAREMGLEVKEIREAEYAILSLKGSVPTCIHEGWKYAMEVFLPEQGYMHAGTPDFEVYSEGDMYSPDYKMELWIPLSKKE
jgi:predicted transcriptional regulator YdeE